MYSLRNRHEKLTEGSLFCLFLKLVQINFIFTDNVRILYIYFYGFILHKHVNDKSFSDISHCCPSHCVSQLIKVVTIIWFQSYLAVNNKCTPLSITCGVPQGYFFYPVFFLYYVNDMSIRIYSESIVRLSNICLRMYCSILTKWFPFYLSNDLRGTGIM